MLRERSALRIRTVFFLEEEWNKNVNDTHSQNNQAPNSALSKHTCQIGCKAVLTIQRINPQKICHKTRTTCADCATVEVRTEASRLQSRSRSWQPLRSILVSACSCEDNSVRGPQRKPIHGLSVHHSQQRSLKERKSAGKNFEEFCVSSDRRARLTANEGQSSLARQPHAQPS